MSFLRDLRSAALQHPDVLQRKLLRDITDELQSAIDRLAKEPTAETARNFNGAWVRAHWLLHQLNHSPNPSGGTRKVA